jgi:peptidyl-prolyl cis-trans isomerase A (cyclophilin A)
MRFTAITLTIAALLLTIAPATLPAQNKFMSPALLNETAPDKFQAKFDTSKGEFIIEVTRAWAPKGADRFYNLVKSGFYNDCRFYRVVPNFMVQFGINGDPKVSQAWRTSVIKDDPNKKSNSRGFITFATSGQDSRTTQVFINFKDNAFLDGQGFAPFGKVIKGMDIVDSFYSEYGETTTQKQPQIQMQGNAYLNKEFSKLDFIKTATIVAADAK